MMLLNLRAIAPIKEEQYLKICEDNPDLKLELDQDGTLIVMPPTGGITGSRNSEINYQLQAWNKRKKLGKVFDSSTEFKLPNGAFRSPDAAWISIERWDNLTKEEQEKFIKKVFIDDENHKEWNEENPDQGKAVREIHGLK